MIKIILLYVNKKMYDISKILKYNKKIIMRLLIWNILPTVDEFYLERTTRR